MEPLYMIENRYTYIAGIKRAPLTTDYEASSPETAFERQIQLLYLDGHAHLQHEEYGLALDRFRELMALILRTAHPQMPVDPNRIGRLKFPFDAALVDTFSTKAGELLKRIPVKSYEFPVSMVSEQSILPTPVVKQLQGASGQGLQYASHHGFVKEQTDAAVAELDTDNFAGAVKLLQAALQNTPATDAVLRGSLLHDLAVISEKAGKAQEAQNFSSQSIESFKAAGRHDAQVQALDTASGIFLRTGKADQSKTFATQAAEIRSKVNINPIFVRPAAQALLRSDLALKVRPTPGLSFATGGAGAATRPIGAFGREAAELQSTPAAPQLIGLSLVQPGQITKKFSMTGLTETAAIALDANATANVKAFHQTLSDTERPWIAHGLLDDSDPDGRVSAAHVFLRHSDVDGRLPGGHGQPDGGRGDIPEARCPIRSSTRRIEIVEAVDAAGAALSGPWATSAYRSAKDNDGGVRGREARSTKTSS